MKHSITSNKLTSTYTVLENTVNSSKRVKWTRRRGDGGGGGMGVLAKRLW